MELDAVIVKVLGQEDYFPYGGQEDVSRWRFIHMTGMVKSIN